MLDAGGQARAGEGRSQAQRSAGLSAQGFAEVCAVLVWAREGRGDAPTHLRLALGFVAKKHK